MEIIKTSNHGSLFASKRFSSLGSIKFQNIFFNMKNFVLHHDPKSLIFGHKWQTFFFKDKQTLKSDDSSRKKKCLSMVAIDRPIDHTTNDWKWS